MQSISVNLTNDGSGNKLNYRNCKQELFTTETFESRFFDTVIGNAKL